MFLSHRLKGAAYFAFAPAIDCPHWSTRYMQSGVADQSHVALTRRSGGRVRDKVPSSTRRARRSAQPLGLAMRVVGYHNK